MEISEDIISKDVLKIKKLIGRYGYKTLTKMVDQSESEMAVEIKTLFKFDLFAFEGKDYITSENMVSFLSKLEPYVENFDLNELQFTGIQHEDIIYIPISRVFSLMREIEKNVDAFNLDEIATSIELQMENKEQGN